MNTTTEPQSTVQIGINPLTWSNDDLPSLGGITTLETCLNEGRMAGYSGFELGNKFPRDPDALGAVLHRHGLRLASGWFSGGFRRRPMTAEFAALNHHIHLLKSLGCKALIYCETTDTVQGDRHTPLSRRPRLRPAEMPAFARQLTAVADHVAAAGLTLCYHFHMGTVIETMNEVEDLLAHCGDSVRLLLDTGHCYFAGGDPLLVARRFAERIGHVHCKDMRAALVSDCLNRDTSFIDAILAGAFAIPGEGCIDWLPIFTALSEAHYNGWLIVEAEQDPVIAPSRAQAEKAFQTVTQIARRAGMSIAP